jgi:ACS family glucarate transporter-like MFS transporter
MGSTEILLSDPVRPRQTNVRYLVLGCACLLALVAYVQRLTFTALSPDLKGSLHLDDRQMGYLWAMFLFTYGVFEVPWGVLGDRFGVRHLLTLIAVASALLTGAVALVIFLPVETAGPLAFLLLLRFLFGLFQAGLFPQISRMMADWMPMRERATAQGLIWMNSRLGGALAPLLLAALIAQYGAWPQALAGLTVLGVLAPLGFWWWFRNRPEEMKRVNAAELESIAAGRVGAAGGPVRVPWGRILRSPSVWALCGLYGFGGFAANFFVTFLPIYLRDYRHLTPDVTKWMSSLPLACGIGGCVLGGILSDAIIRTTGNRKWGRRVSGMVGQTGAGLAFLATIWVQDSVALAVLLGITFFCNDLGMGPAWAACSDVGERFAGTIGGKMNMVGNMAGGLGMLVAGQLLAAGQETLIFIVFACSFWLSALCWLGLDVTRPVTADQPVAG